MIKVINPGISNIAIKIIVIIPMGMHMFMPSAMRLKTDKLRNAKNIFLIILEKFFKLYTSENIMFI